MPKSIKLKLEVDGKEGNKTLTLTDENIKKIINSVNRANQTNQSYSRGMINQFADTRIAIQSVKESYSILKGIFGETVGAAGEQERAEMKVEQAIRSTSKAAGFEADQLKKVSTELQTLTSFGDEEILNKVTAQLLTFTNITQDNFLRTQKVALDLATVLDGDLQSASIMLGKALNDPVANLSALSRAGIQFSTDQKTMVKDLVESNQLFEAQSIILIELERQYGGQAEAFAKTGIGTMQQFSQLMGDSKEKIGDIITTGLLPLTKHMITTLTNLNQASPIFTGVAGTVGVLTTALVILNATGVLPFIFNHTKLITSLKVANTQLVAGNRAGLLYAGGMRAAGTATKGFFASLGPIGWAILGLTALAEIINLVSSESENAVDNLNKLNTESLETLKAERDELEKKYNITAETLALKKKELEIREEMGIEDTYTKELRAQLKVKGDLLKVNDLIVEREKGIVDAMKTQVRSLEDQLKVDLQKTDKNKQLLLLQQGYAKDKALFDDALEMKIISKEDYHNRINDLNKVYETKRAAIIKETNEGILSEYDKKISELNKKRMFAKDLNDLAAIDAMLARIKKEKQLTENALFDIKFGNRTNIDAAGLKPRGLDNVKSTKKYTASDEHKSDLKNELFERDQSFEKQYSLLEAWKKKEQELYKNDAEAKTLIDKVYTQRRNEIAKNEAITKIQTSQMVLGMLSGLFAEHTAIAKSVAIANIIISSAQAQMAALEKPPMGLGPVWGWTLLPLILTQAVASINQISGATSSINESTSSTPTLTGYAKGGAIVGEAGEVEIIAPAKDYAQGMSELTTRIVSTVDHILRGNTEATMNKDFINELKQTRAAIEDLANGGIEAFIKEKNFNKGVRNANAKDRRSKI